MAAGAVGDGGLWRWGAVGDAERLGGDVQGAGRRAGGRGKRDNSDCACLWHTQ